MGQMVQFVKIIESHCKFISFLNTSAYHAYTRYINIKLKDKNMMVLLSIAIKLHDLHLKSSLHILTTIVLLTILLKI